MQLRRAEQPWLREDLEGRRSCSGHAWLRVNWAGNVSSWSHDASKVEFYAPGNNGIVWSEHKSCETCGSKKINH